ncbi:MAG: TolC family protein [Geobacteraceae bacterium]|nr:TolC family protein [Geobacteraceae bacterium]NTW79141.1 TolC family protein [Geobacteraceae bacterium]
MKGKFAIERTKWSVCCTLIVVGLFTLTSIALGTDTDIRNVTDLKSKPSGVLANAANAAAAAANAANAAANAANAAAKAATAALNAINGILQSPVTPPDAVKSQSVQNPADPAQNLPPNAIDLLLASPAKELQNEPSAGAVGFVTPGEQSLVGLVGKFEIPVFADVGGEFTRNIAGNQILENETAGEIGETNLTESIRAGRDFSRESLAANMRTEQAKAQTGQALAILLPSVSVRASSGSENSAPSVAIDSATGKPRSSDTHNRTDLSLTVRQPLFDLPSFLDWRRRGVVENSRNESYRVSDGDAYISSVNAYLSLVSSRLQTDMTRDFEAQLNELLVYVEKRASAGAASVSDMARVRARSQGAMSSRLEQESAHAASGVEFVRLTNLVPRTVRLPELADVGALKLPESLDVAVTTAMLYNPEIATLNAELQAAKMDQSVAKSRFLPRVDAEYTDNYSLHAGGDTSSAGQRDKRLMMVLNWSLFSGGSDYKYHIERIARHKELQYRLDDQRRRIVQTLSANYATLATTRERLNAGYRELKSMSTAAEAMSKRMLSGNQSLLDLLDVYDRYYQARVRLVNLHVLEMSTVTQIVRLTIGTPGKVVALKSSIDIPTEPIGATTPPAAEVSTPVVAPAEINNSAPKDATTPAIAEKPLQSGAAVDVKQ